MQNKNNSVTTAVVILNWNGRALLEEFMPKVVKNTPLHLADIIVADNASSDDSTDFLRNNYPVVGIIQLDENYGFAGGYNRALAQLSHQYVVLLNSDVAPAPNWLEPLIQFMENHPQAAACVPKIKDYRSPQYFEYAGAAGGMIDWLGYPFCRGRIMNVLEQDRGQYDTTESIFWGSGAALMVRNQLYQEVGGLDEDFFAHMEEIDLCWRLKNRGYGIFQIPESTIYHLGGGTLSQQNHRKTYLNFRNNLFMMVKNLPTRWWPLILMIRLKLDGVAALHFVAKGEFKFFGAVVKAHVHFYRELGRFVKKRRMLQPMVRVKKHPEIYSKSIIWSFFVQKKRTYSQL